MHIQPNMKQEWQRNHWTPTSLFKLGLIIQLGHDRGSDCTLPEKGHPNFMVMHVNGLHRVSVSFCGCKLHLTHRVQLLRASWWPATPFNPQTCATLEVLRHFQYLNLQGKISPFNYYRSLELLTDAPRLTGLPVSVSLSKFN